MPSSALLSLAPHTELDSDVQNGAYGGYGAPQGPATRTPQYGHSSHSSNEPLIITGEAGFTAADCRTSCAAMTNRVFAYHAGCILNKILALAAGLHVAPMHLGGVFKQA